MHDEMLVLETTGLRDTLQAIQRNARGIAFVVSKDRTLKGVVTDGDVRRAILRGLSLDAPAGQFMTSNPVTVESGASAERILSRMSEKIRYVPVIDQDGRFVDYAAFAHSVRLPVAAPSFPGNELRYVTECLITNWISSQGRFVGEFERSFAQFCGAKHGVAVSNGTVALHLALVLAGVGPGDEVIVPTLTFIATANAVRYTGASPVFADCDPRTWTLDPAEVERKVNESTKAIIPVHLYGHPADMDALLDIGRRHHLFVIEDAAEAHGALYKGARVGALGNVGCFSFFGNKIITTGEGGMLTTNDDALANRARILRDHGMSRTRKYWHETVGFNYRLTNLQAAIGLAQVEQIETFLAQRETVAATYGALLAGDDAIELAIQAPWAARVNWLYTLLLREGIDRDVVLKGLNERGIDSRPTFVPIHTMPPYQTAEWFPNSEAIANRGLSLPSSVDLKESDVERVCSVLRGCIASQGTEGLVTTV